MAPWQPPCALEKDRSLEVKNGPGYSRQPLLYDMSCRFSENKRSKRKTVLLPGAVHCTAVKEKRERERREPFASSGNYILQGSKRAELPRSVTITYNSLSSTVKDSFAQSLSGTGLLWRHIWNQFTTLPQVRTSPWRERPSPQSRPNSVDRGWKF